jgi:(1->4)-alpha-D-glucan 1-alpha-D-glucosylmutase
MFRATYRLQLHNSFRLEEATALTRYLHDLGVSHLYLSPIFESKPGSNHGYDGTDPSRISAERGGEEAFERLIVALRKKSGLEGVILDIVPNHLAATWLNPYWWDVLEKGPASRYWKSFDIRPREGIGEKVLLPVLGRSRSALLAAREITLDFDEARGLVFRYWDNRFPVSSHTYPVILEALAGCLSGGGGTSQAWSMRLSRLARSRSAKKALGQWLSDDKAARRAVSLGLRLLPLKVLESSLAAQNYVLEEWRAGSRKINYRRFFDINELAALRVEDEFTFRWSHEKLRELFKRFPEIHGLRVDHVDGLTDPEAYLKKLNRISQNVWVEKILGEGEKVPRSWPVVGTTGYEFLGSSARLFVDLPGLLHLHSHYTRGIDRRWERFHDCMYDSKREMLESHFTAEFGDLVEEFFRMACLGASEPGFTKSDLREVLFEVTASMRVYRTYMVSGMQTHDLGFLEQAFREVEGRGRYSSKASLEWLRKVLFSRGDWSESTYRAIKRWEQLTGPVMAKGLEDTALYRYFPLLSLNVVGGEPDWVGDGAIEFHGFNQERLRHEPLTMNTTSTHDTKRSEDVRSRIHVISELSEEWAKLFHEWEKMNSGLKASRSPVVPDSATEYLIYETLLGAWPFLGSPDAVFAERMKQYFLKATREAKSQTSWIEPDPVYEGLLMKFVDDLLDRIKSAAFWRSFIPFVEKCAYFGAFNSLSLLALKALSPGVPDFYQGCELWDLSLVDPDNRRPVDFIHRAELLRRTKAAHRNDRRGHLRDLTAEWKSGEIKLWLTHRLLGLRAASPDLFIHGEYQALNPQGPNRRHFVSFARFRKSASGERWAVVIAPRFLASGSEPGAPSTMKPKRSLKITNPKVLQTEIQLPSNAPTVWRNELTGETVRVHADTLRLCAGEALGGLPVAVLTAKR